MKEDEIKYKRIHLLYGVFILILVIALVLTNFFNITGISHTRQLNKFKEKLTSLKLPPNTYSIGSYSEVGHVYHGNGDNCDYIAGEFFETELSREEIVKYYSNISLPSVNRKLGVDLDILFFERKSSRGRLQYQIQVFEDALDAGFDLRCF